LCPRHPGGPLLLFKRKLESVEGYFLGGGGVGGRKAASAQG